MTPEEREQLVRDQDDGSYARREGLDRRAPFDLGHGWPPESLIAFAREAIRLLPDDHPAKITREMVAEIRQAAESIEGEWGATTGAGLHAIADALESYLLPEGT